MCHYGTILHVRTKRDIEQHWGNMRQVRRIDLLARSGNHIKRSGTGRAKGIVASAAAITLAVSAPLAVDGAATPKTVLGPVLLI